MRILSRYVFREVLTSALLGTALATFIIFLQGPGKLLLRILVGTSVTPQGGAKLFLYALPQVFPLAIPFGALVGILIGLGRMASDGEITAMRAAGISSRTVSPPVLVFCSLAAAVAACASLWLTPLAIRNSYIILNRIAAEQLTADVQPRVFEESFPKTVLYVSDILPTKPVVWRRVFLADLTPPEERPMVDGKPIEGPRITIADRIVAVPDLVHNSIQLSLQDASSHEIAQGGQGYHQTYPRGQQVLDASQPSEVKAKAYSEMPTPELYRTVKTTDKRSDEGIGARVEFHSRLALPLACIVLGLIGISLGVHSRKGGKSAGYIVAIFLSFFCYYLAYISLVGMARQRTLSVELAVWLPNMVCFVAGVVMLAGLERPGDRDILGTIRHNIAGLWNRLVTHSTRAPRYESRSSRSRFLLFQILDFYVLSQFLFYLGAWLLSFVAMAQVYNFFELLSYIVRNKIPLIKVFTFLAFLTPKLIYDTLPISVLVAVLVTFGVMTKNNEVTAFKASGVSVRRLGLPVILLSILLSGALFAFDHYYIPQANLKQDAIRNEIKGRAVQTYLRPDRKWIFSTVNSRIFYYKIFDTAQNIMVGVNVYELDPDTFQLRKQISAERAQWQPQLKSWIFQDGVARDVNGTQESNYNAFQATTFPELTEPPSYFIKEVKQDKQMNYLELQRYIKDLQQSGFDTVQLRVQLYKKFSVPIFTLIMAMISIPFGFLVGNRGAMAGIGVGLVVAMAYWGVDKLFEQIGNVNQLPPVVAAWAPDALFFLAGSYLLLRMKS